MAKKAAIKYRSLKTNLVHLPLSLYAPLVQQQTRPQSLIINLKHLPTNGQQKPSRASQVSLGWSGLASASSLEMYGSGQAQVETVEMDPEVASGLGWKEGDLVEVGVVRQATKGRSVSVTPATSDDWEVLELHTGYLENYLLSQLRAASAGMDVSVWVQGKTKISLHIDETSPPSTASNAVLITPDTEIFVAPRPRKKEPLVKPKPTPQVQPSQPQPTATASIKQATATVEPETKESDHALPQGYVSLRSVPRRVFSRWVDLVRTLTDGPPGGWCSRRTLDALRVRAGIPGEGEAAVEVVPLPEGGKGVKAVLRCATGIADGDVVFWPPLLKEDAWARVGVVIDENPKKQKPKAAEPMSVDFPVDVLAGVDDIMQQCTRYYQQLTALSRLEDTSLVYKKPLLLCGASGSGKTSIAQHIARTLEADRKLPLETIYVDCKAPQGSVTGAKQLIEGWMKDARVRQPCLVVLDNLERIVPEEVEQADNTRTRTTAEYLVSELTRAGPRTYVLATATSAMDCHSLLRTKHVFGKTIDLKAPTSDIRRQILGKILSSRHRVDGSALDLTTVAHEAEGYVAADLNDLVENAMQQALVRQMTGDASGICNADFERASQEFKPRSLRQVKLQKSDVQWSDIGGLHETRRVLRETLEWPTKYSVIFAKCPLRLRSGLLLYGFPGCGKTLLASAVAKECGLNFISVKGPELLNKYIGASEKSVRDVFERAVAAKPCVLFFDEFDSIAPKRGHDSTGVTDRVVNQLLTEMDGAEGLDGVYVLAATSRPDLIDAALLRPGRLDKSLLCGMPDDKDRLEIMQAVSRKIALDPSVNLEEYVDSTQGFSGADLQAFIYNGQLEAVHDIVEEDRDGPSTRTSEAEAYNGSFHVWKAGSLHGSRSMAASERSVVSKQVESLIRANAEAEGEGGNVKPVLARSQPIVKEHHLERSLSNTKPSLPANERQRLETIYRRFVSDRAGGLQDGQAAEGVGQRASLM